MVVLAGVLATGCRARIARDHERDWYAGGGVSVLPQVGVSAGAGRVLARKEHSDVALEAEATFQFLDDADFADDGFPTPGNYMQGRLGVAHFYSPGHRRQLFLRYGLVAVHAEGPGEPLIMEKPGTYAGAYFGWGFLTNVSETFHVGPEMRYLLVTGRGRFEFVPQLVWHVSWRF